MGKVKDSKSDDPPLSFFPITCEFCRKNFGKDVMWLGTTHIAKFHDKQNQRKKEKF